MGNQEKVIINYAHSQWTDDFGKTLLGAAVHWWDIILPALEAAPSRLAFDFLDTQLAERSPLDISGWGLTITIPALNSFVFRPDGTFEFYGYHEQSKVAAFRWQLGSDDRRVMLDWLDFSAGVDAYDRDDPIFVLVQLNGERSAPAVIILPEGLFTSNGVMMEQEMERLTAEAEF